MVVVEVADDDVVVVEGAERIERHTRFRGESEGQQDASYREFVASCRDVEASARIGDASDGDGEYVVLNGVRVKLGLDGDKGDDRDKGAFLGDLKAAVGRDTGTPVGRDAEAVGRGDDEVVLSPSC